MRQRNRGGISYSEETLRAGNHGKVLLGGGILNVYYLERERMDGCSAGRAAWWRSENVLDRRDQAITVSI